MGPSSKSFAHVRRAHRVIQEVGITFRRFYVVGGYGFPAELASRASEETGLPFIGKIAEDPGLARQVLLGKSLMDMPEDSPAYRSVAGIMEKVLAGG